MLTLPMLLMFMVSLAITVCHKQLQWMQEHMQKFKEERSPWELAEQTVWGNGFMVKAIA